MHPAQTPSPRINQLTEPEYPPLTPEEIEQNWAIVDRLLSEVFEGEDTLEAD